MGELLISTGRVGRDAELKFTAQGTQVATFSLAVDQGYGDKRHTAWRRVTCWGKLAETVAQYVTKGKIVEVYAEVQEPRCYQAKDGTWKAAQLEITARTVNFLSGKSDAAQNAGGDDLGEGVTAIVDEEEIPF